MTRLGLVLICLAVLALALRALHRGWVNRAARQSFLPPLPAPPAQPGAELLAPLTGLYVGTTFATSWQDRVVHAGLGARATATAHWYESGLFVERHGARPIFVPMDAVEGARLAPGLAGKVVGPGSLLVVRWRLGDSVLDTGVRADDVSACPAWVRAICARVAA